MIAMTVIATRTSTSVKPFALVRGTAWFIGAVPS
jgi:hypothetical protein